MCGELDDDRPGEKLEDHLYNSFLAHARRLLAENEFIEIFVDAPLAIAEQRDPKGLYKKARRGELKNFTGIDSPYEAPEHPEIRIDTMQRTIDEAADAVIAALRERGMLAHAD